MHSLKIACLFALTSLFVFACHSGDKAGAAAALTDSSTFTTIQWLDSASRDYGKITEGQMLDVTYRFRNTGSTPLVIGRVQPSCGCTVAEQPKAPIAPGGEGEIRATFNSQGRTGVNHKTLFVSANTRGKQTYSLQFAVLVEKKPS
jgi:uncharacterized protein DUF1573